MAFQLGDSSHGTPDGLALVLQRTEISSLRSLLSPVFGLSENFTRAILRLADPPISSSGTPARPLVSNLPHSPEPCAR